MTGAKITGAMITGAAVFVMKVSVGAGDCQQTTSLMSIQFKVEIRRRISIVRNRWLSKNKETLMLHWMICSRQERWKVTILLR
jgi:predicted lipid carrier protein YhbT